MLLIKINLKSKNNPIWTLNDLAFSGEGDRNIYNVLTFPVISADRTGHHVCCLMGTLEPGLFSVTR